MNYTEIVNLALSYADREDVEVIDRMDDFLRVVEANINRVLRVSKMVVRATLTSVDDQEYYGLPADFGGLRDIEVQDTTGKSRVTLQYLSPQQMNDRVNSSDVMTAANPELYYTLLAQQVQIYPPQSDTIIEIVYYQKLTPLTEVTINNWLSDNNPDAYVFGLLVEISSFVKDAQAAALWGQRFADTIRSITAEDRVDRWSGTQLEVRVGG